MFKFSVKRKGDERKNVIPRLDVVEEGVTKSHRVNQASRLKPNRVKMKGENDIFTKRPRIERIPEQSTAKLRKKQLPEPESELVKFNKYDFMIGNKLVEMAGEEGDFKKALVKLLDMIHWMKKSNIYEIIRNAESHYGDLKHISRKDRMRLAIHLRKDAIDQLMEHQLKIRSKK